MHLTQRHSAKVLFSHRFVRVIGEIVCDWAVYVHYLRIEKRFFTGHKRGKFLEENNNRWRAERNLQSEKDTEYQSHAEGDNDLKNSRIKTKTNLL